MKRLFVVGASVLQLPAIKKAKEMGLYVAAADFNPNAAGIPYADEFFEVSTIDEEGICQAAKEFKADGIMTLATDMPMRSVAYTCEKLGLRGISYETAVKATDKGKMIQAFEESGVAHPWYFVISEKAQLSDIKDKIIYPCISKPVDNAGSRGVMLVNQRSELEDAFLYSSTNGRGGQVIIEEYLQGDEVSVEIMAVDGRINVLQVTDKLTTGAPHFVEMGHSQPSRLGDHAVDEIKKIAIKAVESVGIENGPAHVEIMMTDSGPKMIELGARMGGDCIATHLVPLSTGIDMVKASILIALGETPDVSPKFCKGSAIRYFNGQNGIIQSVSGVEDAEKIAGVREIILTKGQGDTVGEITSSTDRIGAVIAQGEDAACAVEVCRCAEKKVKISYKIEKTLWEKTSKNRG